jgi:hypothetical protein
VTVSHFRDLHALPSSFGFSELEVTAAVVSFHVKHTFSLQYGYKNEIPTL